MKIQAYLIISQSGSVRMVKGAPSLSNIEIAIKVNLNIPDSFFHRLIPVVDIDVPADAILSPGIESVVHMMSQEISEKLEVDVNDVEDGLKNALNNKENNEKEYD